MTAQPGSTPSTATPSAAHACEECLARSWLLSRLAAHLERVRARIDAALRLPDDELIAAVGGDQQVTVRRELAGLDAAAHRQRCAQAGLQPICRCDAAYPLRLRDLPGPPAVLHVAGGLDRFLVLMAGEPVAIVGARRASQYGLEVARSLGRGLGCAGITVVSGMALGIDAAAHAGALSAPAPTVAVLPGSADRPYPAGKRALHRQIIATGAAVSELGPGAGVWRWTFPARNRIIAALGAMTVLVEAGERSGALLTARLAGELDRPVGAVPGRITAPAASGPNGLLATGAHVVRGPQDVLDQLFGAGIRHAAASDRVRLAPELQRLLDAIAEGHDTAAAIARSGVRAQESLAALACLELEGYVRRVAGGRFMVVP